MRIHSTWIGIIVAGMVLLAAPAAQASETEVHLNGATSLAKMITAKVADLEAKLGVKIIPLGNGSGRGMLDLNSGKADIGLIGGPLRGVVEETAKQNPKESIKAEDFTAVRVSSVPLVVAVNPSNGVSALTLEQFVDIFSGKIQNWRELGGADQPITVVLPPLGDGARTYIQYDILKDKTFTKDAKPVTLSPYAVKVVAQAPGGIAFISPLHVNDTVKTLKIDASLEMVLSLVTKGDPTPGQQKVIDAVKEVLK